jgi:hypothetical protein
MGVKVGVCVAVNVVRGVGVVVATLAEVKETGISVCGNMPKQLDSSSTSNSHTAIHPGREDLDMGRLYALVRKENRYSL